MENLKKEIKRGFDLHIKKDLKSENILKGDLIIFDALFSNRLKNKEDYEVLYNYFKDLILKELEGTENKELFHRKSDVKRTPIDKEIIRVINTIDIDVVVDELLRLNNGKKKMIRAKMVYNTFGSEDIYLASLIELFHLATLIQDDVIDKADYRRFEETINKRYSNKIAIIISDILIIKVALEIKVYLENKITKNDEEYKVYFEKEIKNLVTKLIFSESYVNEITNLEDYEKYSIYKTANLFSFGNSATYISNSYPNVKKEEVKELKNFSKNFGIIFQKIDDLIDYRNNFSLSGKNSTDKKNGVKNYIYLMLENHSIDEIKEIIKKDLELLKDYSCSKYYEEEIKLIKEKLYEQ